MARSIQVLLPLVCLVLAEAQVHIPFFDDIPGLPHVPRSITHGLRDNGGYDTWFQHFGNPDEHSFNSDSHERDNSYEDYDPYYHGDPYFQGNGWNQIPGINNVFNIPKPGYSNHKHQPSHKGNNPQERPKQNHNHISNVQKPKEKPNEIPPIVNKPTEPKLNEDNIPDKKDKLKKTIIADVKNNSNLLPPKSNKNVNEDGKADKDNKQTDLKQKKDFLLVGQGNNGNNVYLLHDNDPNPNTVVIPNGNQPGNNIIYVPYNPGQTNNPGYQVINGQPGSLPTNVQMTEDKTGVSNGYDNAGQSTPNLNIPQNPGYVTIYSNGQLIQVPGVVVNSTPNNVPVQNGNPIQGTNYLITNTVPNNVQTVPTNQNLGSNAIYATIPNQASNGPIYYVQVPNCGNAMSNGCRSGTVQGVNNGMSNNGLPSNMLFYQGIPNTVAPNQSQQGAITIAIPNQGTVFSDQNSPYQPAVELPVNSGTNGYNQPLVSILGQGQNAPNQGGMMGNQNVPIQTAVLMPVGSNNNGYNQATVTSQNQQDNAPTPGVMYNQYTPPQPAVQMPVNNGVYRYNQSMVSNQPPGPDVPNQGGIVSNQNTPSQPAVEISIPNGYNVNPPVTNPSPAVTVENRGDMSGIQNVPPHPSLTLNSGSNGYQQPQVPNQGDQGTIVNTPNNGEVINQESDKAQPLATSSLVLDSNYLSSLGALPAVMISDFKDKSVEKKDEKSKDKKDKKPEDDDKPKPFTNRMEDVKR